MKINKLRTFDRLCKHYFSTCSR